MSADPVYLSLYVYAPNQVAPIIFSIGFGIAAVLHTIQCHRYKSWKLAGWQTLCAYFFTTGYALRAYQAFGNNYVYSLTSRMPLGLFIASQVLIYISPPVMELCNYHTLGRLFYFVPHCSPMPPGRVLAIFAGVMLVVETINSIGVSLTSNSSAGPGRQEAGSALILAAVIMQLIVIGTFVVLMVLFQRRCAKTNLRNKTVSIVVNTLYGSMTLIFVRCMYRLVEHTGNTHRDIADVESMRHLNPLLRNEIYFLVLDAATMLVNSFVWIIWHPGRVMPREHHKYLDGSGILVEGKKGVDDRTRGEKIGHVLSFGVLYQRNKHAVRVQSSDGTSLINMNTA